MNIILLIQLTTKRGQTKVKKLSIFNNLSFVFVIRIL